MLRENLAQTNAAVQVLPAQAARVCAANRCFGGSALLGHERHFDGRELWPKGEGSPFGWATHWAGQAKL